MSLVISRRHVGNCGRYLNAIEQALEKRYKDPVTFTYSRRQLKKVESEIISMVSDLLSDTSNENDLAHVLDGAIESKYIDFKDDLLIAYRYVTLFRRLTFKPFYLIKNDDKESLGVLKRNCNYKIGPRISVLGGDLVITKALRKSSRDDLLEIEWRFFAAISTLKNRSYVEELINTCPMALLVSIKSLIDTFCIENPDKVDKRRFVPPKFEAVIGGDTKTWSGRGVAPHVFSKLFKDYGQERFDVKSDSFNPEI